MAKVMRPLGDRVVVHQYKEKATTEGGIVRPDASRRTLPIGRLIAVGALVPDEYRKAIGSDVRFAGWSGASTGVETEDYVEKLMFHHEVLGYVEEVPE